MDVGRTLDSGRIDSLRKWRQRLLCSSRQEAVSENSDFQRLLCSYQMPRIAQDTEETGLCAGKKLEIGVEIRILATLTTVYQIESHSVIYIFRGFAYVYRYMHQN